MSSISDPTKRRLKELLRVVVRACAKGEKDDDEARDICDYLISQDVNSVDILMDSLEDLSLTPGLKSILRKEAVNAQNATQAIRQSGSSEKSKSGSTSSKHRTLSKGHDSKAEYKLEDKCADDVSDDSDSDGDDYDHSIHSGKSVGRSTDEEDRKQHQQIAAELDRAAILTSQGEFDKAEVIYIDCLEARMELLGADHPQTLSSLISLANLYIRIKLYSEAEPLYVECYKKYAKGLGKDHLYTRRVADKIKRCRAKMYTNSASSIDSGESSRPSLPNMHMTESEATPAPLQGSVSTRNSIRK